MREPFIKGFKRRALTGSTMSRDRQPDPSRQDDPENLKHYCRIALSLLRYQYERKLPTNSERTEPTIL